MARTPSKLSKADAYLNKIFTAEYDLEGMIIAYGAAHVASMLDMIVAELKEGNTYNIRRMNARKKLARSLKNSHGNLEAA